MPEDVVLPQLDQPATTAPTSTRFRGLLALSLIFLASAGFTYAYFIELPQSEPLSNVAAAALPDPFRDISLTAESAYVLDLKTGRVLYSKNADAQLPLASLTKVALALAVFDMLPTTLRIPTHSTPDGAPIRLPESWQFAARDIIDFTLVASSNEGAEILAAAAASNIKTRFPEADGQSAALWRMNNIAQHLGLGRTYFLNVTGLDVSSTQAGAYGSAHDVALLFGYAASTSPDVFELTTKDTLTIEALSGQSITATNTDEALPSIPGLVLGKTGYTDLAGGNLAVVFEAGPAHPIVAVVMRSTLDGRFEDMRKIVDTTHKSIAAGY